MDPAGCTGSLVAASPDVRVCIGAGMLVQRFALFAALVGDVIEVFGITVDR